MYLPNGFRLPNPLGQPSPNDSFQKQLSPTFGGVIRPSPYSRPLMPGLGGPCPRGGLPQPPVSSAIPASLPSITTLPGFSAARMTIENRTGPPVCGGIPRPVPVPSAQTATAAAVHWIQQQQHQQQEAQAAVAFNLQSQLQQFLANEKAFAASQFMDPFANAGNPFFDLARMGGHFPLGKKLFGCPQCRYMTDRKNNLKRHISTMHQECDKALECCGVLFKNKASLRDHVLIFHSNGYMCRFCGRNFCRKALLKRHLTVHSGQKDYICSQCDYATSHKSNLERHKKVHERNGSDGSDNESVYTEKSNHPSLANDRHFGKDKIELSQKDNDLMSEDDDLNLSDIDVDNEEDPLIDVVDIDIVSNLHGNLNIPPTSQQTTPDTLVPSTKLKPGSHSMAHPITIPSTIPQPLNIQQNGQFPNPLNIEQILGNKTVHQVPIFTRDNRQGISRSLQPDNPPKGLTPEI